MAQLYTKKADRKRLAARALAKSTRPSADDVEGRGGDTRASASGNRAGLVKRCDGREMTMSNEERKEGRYWTNADGTPGYQPFTDDNFDNCDHCGGPHADEVEIVQGKDRAITYLHRECEAPYRKLWGDKIIIRTRPDA